MARLNSVRIWSDWQFKRYPGTKFRFTYQQLAKASKRLSGSSTSSATYSSGSSSSLLSKSTASGLSSNTIARLVANCHTNLIKIPLGLNRCKLGKSTATFIRWARPHLFGGPAHIYSGGPPTFIRWARPHLFGGPAHIYSVGPPTFIRWARPHLFGGPAHIYSVGIFSNDEIKAPIGIPPPRPFPVIIISGITL